MELKNKELTDELFYAVKERTAEKEYWHSSLVQFINNDSFFYNLNPAALTDLKAERDNSVKFRIGGEVYQRIWSIANRNLNMLFVYLMSCYSLLLHRYSHLQDINMGTTIFRQENSEDLLNRILLVRSIIEPADTLKNHLVKMNRLIAEVFRNQNYPLQVLARELEIPAPFYRFSLFDNGFVLSNLQNRDYFSDIALPVLFCFTRHEDYLECEINYNSRLLADIFMERMAANFEQLLVDSVLNINNPINTIGITADYERDLVINRFNPPGTAGPAVTVVDLFMEQARSSPEKTALVDSDPAGGEREISYAQLNEIADITVKALTANNIEKGAVIGLICDRSAEMIGIMLGVLKAGCAYIPVDPAYPVERINYILTDSAAAAVIISGKHEHKSVNSGCVLIDFDSERSAATGAVAERESALFPSGDDLAYIIYTSGTTGLPKGVMMCQRALAQFTEWAVKAFAYTCRTNAVLTYSLAFDASIQQLYPVLAAGGTIHLLPGEIRANMGYYIDFLRSHRIDIIDEIPSVMNLMYNYMQKSGEINCLPDLKTILVGNETVSADVARKCMELLRPGGDVINVYGPTEACVEVTTYYFNRNAAGNLSLIGNPRPGSRIYILDRWGHCCPIGVPGEIHIAGDCLAAGYMNNRELTDQAFIDDPFSGNARMYRSGDRGRWLEDGNIEFLGRMDEQVQINGFRVELAEIEKLLAESELLADSIVLQKRENEQSRLIVYYISRGNGSQGADIPGRLKQLLEDKLPDYMIPSQFIKIKHFPLTPNGKVDKEKLLTLSPDNTNENHIAPSGELEKEMARIWAEVLNTDTGTVSINHNFFQVGGTSLTAMNFISLLYQQLGKEITLSQFIENPEISALAALLESPVDRKPGIIRKAAEREYYALSINQKRLWLIEHMTPGNSSYNLFERITLNEKVNKDHVLYALNRLVRKHDSLGTGFKTVKNNPVQFLEKDIQVPLKIYDFSAQADPAKIIETVYYNDVKPPFDLSSPPLLRAVLIKLAEEEFEFLIVIHHIISDEWSLNILNADFRMFYAEAKKGRMPGIDKSDISYIDYTEWHNEQIGDESLMKDSIDFWTRKIRDKIIPVDFPHDFNDNGDDYAGANYRFEIDDTCTKLLESMARKNNTTLFNVLVSVYTLLLSYFTKQKEITFSVVHSGRDLPSVSEITGYFVNPVIFSCSINEKENFIDTCQKLKEQLAEVFRHQYYPVEIVCEKIKEKVPQIVNVFNMLSINSEKGKRELEPEQLSLTIDVKFNTELYVSHYNNGIEINWNYRKSAFSAETIRYFAGIFTELVNFFAHQPGQSLCSYRKTRFTHILSRPPVTDPETQVTDILISAFRKQKEQYPENTAIRTSKRAVTYRELNRLINQYAGLLLENMDEPERAVTGVYLDDKIDMIAVMFAALAAGVPYVPLTDDIPEDRLVHIIRANGISHCIIDSAIKTDPGFLNKYIEKVININDREFMSDPGDFVNKIPQDRAAYFLNTSGSTGVPKTIIQSQRNIMHFISNYIKALEITAADRLTLFSSFLHDASVMDIYSALFSGAALFIIDIRKEYSLLNQKWFDTGGITIWHSVPSFLRYFLKNLSQFTKFHNIRYVVLGGEEVAGSDLKICRDYFPRAAVYNLYGQTETSYNSGKFYPEDGEAGKITIGKAIANTDIFIINEDGYETGPMVKGEIVIESPFLALNRKKENGGKTTLYRTGDSGRRLLNGEIEFIGRNDRQIKLRGYRVELDEIEQLLKECELVEDAVVLAVPAETESAAETAELVIKSYIMLRRQEPMLNPQQAIRKYLKKKVSDYMLPSSLIITDHFNYLKNGKVDRKALLQWEAPGKSGVAEHRLLSDVEQKVIDIVSGVLNLHDIDINQNFFELGGHSLTAITLISQIYKTFGITLNISTVFEYETLAGLAAYISTAPSSGTQNIVPAEAKQRYHLSSIQKRMFILNQLEPDSTVYNITNVYEVKEDIDVGRLEAAMTKVIRKHKILRTSFEREKNEVYQYVRNIDGFRIDYREAGDENIDELISGFIRPFDLKMPPLIRLLLLKRAAGHFILAFDVHHIAFDGTSTTILFDEIVRYYFDQNMDDLPLQYLDYAEYEYGRLQNSALALQKSYWMQQFQEAPPLLNLPLDYPRPRIFESRGSNFSFSLSKSISRKLRELSRETQTTMYMMILAVYYILLYRYSGQEKIVVGVPISTREHPELQNTIGMFVNSLALQIEIDDRLEFMQFLSEVKKLVVNAYRNSEYPFDKLVEELPFTWERNRNPLFDTILVSHEIALKDNPAALDLKIRDYPIDRGVSRVDLSVTYVENDDLLQFMIEYSTLLFKKATMEKLIGRFRTIVDGIAANPRVKINALEILSNAERNQLLADFNNTSAGYRKEALIHQLFEEQAARTPDAVALQFTDKKMTYRELNGKANQLARRLRAKNISGDVIVGVMAERSPEMMIALFAILKAGGAYLPVDPEYPEERIQFMLADCECALVLTQSHLKNTALFDGEWLALDEDRLYEGDDTNPDFPLSAANLAYIIYTSGSTGKPKGVMIEHYSVINRLNWMQKKYPLNSSDVLLQKTPTTFDVSVWELFWWSFSGACLVLLQPGAHKNPAEILEVIEKKAVTTIHFVPSMFNLFLDHVAETGQSSRLGSLLRIFTSGEALTVEQVDKFNRVRAGMPVRLINLYGPTEATVDVTYFDELQEKDISRVPIGKPIDNTQIYIVDKDFNLQPVGIAGELCIAGDGLARGYLKREDLTREKFVKNPFIPGSRMYRSGDLARWLPDGNIEYLGRIDNQVKIRGFRIELGEIEAQLLKHNAIREAVVTVRNDRNDNKYLCAYIIADKDFKASEIRAHIQKELPDYMIPSYFIPLAAMPLTASGKINRKALPEPNLVNMYRDEYVPPVTRVEKIFVKVWAQVLEIDEKLIGVEDSFFSIGGDSLKAFKVISPLEKKGITLTIRDFIEHETIRAIIENSDIEDDESLINDYEAAEKCLADFLKTAVKLCAFEYSKGVVYNILFVDADVRAVQDEVIRFIMKKLVRQLWPHYIVPYLDDFDYASITREVFNRLTSVEVLTDEKVTELVDRIAGMKQKLKDVITANEPLGTFPASGVNKFTLQNWKINPYDLWVVDRYVDEELLKLAVLKFIKEQMLFRSILISEDDQLYWKEYNFPDNAELPYIDLSGYESSDRDRITEAFWVDRYNHRFSNFNEIGYDFILVKQNMREYNLMFVSIAEVTDVTSGQVLREHILQYYKDFERLKARNDIRAFDYLKDTPSRTTSPYNEYVAQVSRGPLNITEEEFIELFELKDYYESILHCNDVINSTYTANDRIIMDIPLDSTVMENEDRDNDIFWDINIDLFSAVCEEYFHFKTTPLKMPYYGRMYLDATYLNVYGPCLDIIPVLLRSEEEDITLFTKKVQHKIDLVKEKNINFLTLLYSKELREKYPQVVELSRKADIFDGATFLYNYQGRFFKTDFYKKNRISKQVEAIRTMRRRQENRTRGCVWAAMLYDNMLRNQIIFSSKKENDPEFEEAYRTVVKKVLSRYTPEGGIIYEPIKR